MKKLALLPVLFLPIALLAQLTNPSKFSINMEAGAVSSFFNIPENDIVICFVGATSIEEPPPPTSRISPHFALAFNYQLSARHQIGLGVMKSQYGKNIGTHDYDGATVFNYWGIMAKHRLRLLSGGRVSFLLSNSFNLEMPETRSYNGFSLYKGISHLGAFTCAVQLTRSFDIELNMVGKTALTKYADGAWDGRYNRFGMGMTMGLNYTL